MKAFSGDEPQNPYDTRYAGADYYWGLEPSGLCRHIVDMAPPSGSVRLLDIGCGEGRDSVTFARGGYVVSAFDRSSQGIEKAASLAHEAGVDLDLFTADLLSWRPTTEYDVIFSCGVLQYLPLELREEVLSSYRKATVPGGLNAHTVLLEKPFIAPAPDAEKSAHLWTSGELLHYYRDWHIDFFEEVVIDCNSSGVPHQHALDRMVARKPSSEQESRPGSPR
jgi:tellurite methyltransferase